MNKSVTRRSIALMVAVCGLGVMTTLSLQGVVEAFQALVVITGMVIAFYFGTKVT